VINTGEEVRPDIRGDEVRQAVDALRGYAYQLYVSGSAWLDLREKEQLYLEVAEDYATACSGALNAVQVKDTTATATINSEGVLDALDSFIALRESNETHEVHLRYLTTARLGLERSNEDRIGGEAVLSYWRKAASGGEVAPLRARLLAASVSDRVRKFIEERDDEALRHEFLKRIQWECGAPPFEELRRDFLDRLVHFGSVHGIPPSTAEKLSGAVLERLLTTCASRGSRRLSFTDLLRLAEAHSKVPISIAALDSLLGSARADAHISVTADAQFDLRADLRSASELQIPENVNKRKDLLERTVSEILASKIIWLAAGTGFGKTILARMALKEIGGDWFTLSLRDLRGAELLEVLRASRVRLPKSSRGILVDDFNASDERLSVQGLADLLAAAKRRDVAVIVTSYTSFSATVSGEIGLPIVLLPVPELTETEIEEQITLYGGNPRTWGKYVRLSTGGGHPQLVRALVLGLARRDWPAEELKELSALLGKNADLEAVRRECRLRLLSELNEGPRQLLYRLSLYSGSITREFALRMAEVPPSVMEPGGSLDQLVGAWLETETATSFRVSPLVSNVGIAQLSEGTRRGLHGAIARWLVPRSPLDAHQVNAALAHALIGGETEVLSRAAFGVIAAGMSTHSKLAVPLFGLRMLRSDLAIFASDPHLSCLLRLAQCLLVAASDDTSEFAALWTALERETSAIENDEQRQSFWALTLGKTLFNPNCAELIPNTPELIVRFENLAAQKLDFTEVLEELAQANGTDVPSIGTFLCALQFEGIKSISLLRRYFEGLNGLSSDDRKRLFDTKFARMFGRDTVINRAWIAESNSKAIDVNKAPSDYEAIANILVNWGEMELATSAFAAQAVLLDEYKKNSEGALLVLAAAKRQFPEALDILRAETRIRFNTGEFDKALDIGRRVLDSPKLLDDISASYLVREVAISAAKLGRLKLAHDYFRQGYEQSARLGGADKYILPMTIGLLADAAICSWKSGEKALAISEMSKAVEMLADLPFDESLRASHCHRVSRFVLLGFNIEAHEGEWPRDVPYVLEPGMVSNPLPHTEIDEGPLAVYEYCWYMQYS